MRFTHNGHHHCKKTSPPAIKKLAGCRPGDISPALLCNAIDVYHATLIIFNNWRVGMTVTDSLVSADLQPPWWRWPVGTSQDLMQGWPNASTGSEGWPSVFGILLHKQRYVSWLTANKHGWTPWSPVMHMRHMMTSSNGNIFRVTGPLCGEFTGHQWIPHTKASDAELWSLSPFPE